MAEASRSEMDTNPDPSQIILKDVNVMVPGANRSQLIPGHVPQRCQPPCGAVCALRDLPSVVIVKQIVINFFAILPAKPKGNSVPYFIHNFGDRFANIFGLRVRENSLVAASDVIAYARRRHEIFVRQSAADWDSVSLIVI